MTDTEKKIAEIREGYKSERDDNFTYKKEIVEQDIRFLLSELERMKVEVGECQEHYFAMESVWFKAHRENERLRRELEEAKAEAELEGQLLDDANSDLNEALEENETLRRERNKLIEGLRPLMKDLGKMAVNPSNARTFPSYRRMREILKEIGVTVE